jgi:hypothetical protein
MLAYVLHTAREDAYGEPVVDWGDIRNPRSTSQMQMQQLERWWRAKHGSNKDRIYVTMSRPCMHGGQSMPLHAPSTCTPLVCCG